MFLHCIDGLKMRVLIKKWGNSASVRIPAALMQAARLEPDMAVDIREEEGRLILTPAREPAYDLATLLEGITPDNRHDGVDSGEPQGLEAL